MNKIFKFLLCFLLIFTLAGCTEVPIEPDDPDDPIVDPIIEPEDPIDPSLYVDVTMHEFFTKINVFTEYQESYFYMGYWPQREIFDEKVIEAIKDIEETNSRGYIEYKGLEILKFTVVNNHIHAENDQKGDGSFYYGTGYEPGTTHYFLVEPLCWKLMHANTAANEYMLITEDIIDSNCFVRETSKRVIEGQDIYPHNYEYSDIRQWLNETFYDLCFTEEEKAMILDVVNSNECVYQYTQTKYINNPTTDKVWLLSYQQVTSTLYGFKGDGTCDESRLAKASDYANARGLIKHNVEGVVSSIWTTRNAYELAPLHCAYVGYDGLASKAFYVDAENVGTRPAIKITLPNQE